MGLKGILGFLFTLVITAFMLVPLTGDTQNVVSSGGAATLAFASMNNISAGDVVEVQPGRISVNEMERVQPQGIDKTVQVLTLLSFNIHSANDRNGDVYLDQIVKEIKETGAEIIGLQEVERLMPRSGYKDQTKEIAKALGYYYYYGSNINILGVQYGNAFLSKYPILESRNNKLPKELLEPRGFIEAQIDMKGVIYNVFVTHLGLNASERSKQIPYISNEISKKEGNIVLMGDFNNKPNSPEMAELDSRLIDTAESLDQENQYTYSFYNEKPNVRLDRIYASDNITLKVHESKSSTISDHARVITRFSHNIIN
ncbi:MAG: endonuclease/exonuclease/phosphatase family protein [Firmicutes bacterium]|nr:endonuclease/exonuclease/phosphatase family protein [Bacillota bacterium]